MARKLTEEEKAVRRSKKKAVEEYTASKKYELKTMPLNDLQIDDMQLVNVEFAKKIASDPRYSLDVDPEGKYQMTTNQKAFIRYYVQHRNIPLAAKLAQIDEDEAINYYTQYSTKKELERINRALYARQFNTKMIGLTEIGGYLTSLITNENIPAVDQLSSKDKLAVAKMLIDLNVTQSEAINNPKVIDTIDVTNQLKTLSVKSIKSLLSNSENPSEILDKETLISELNKDDVLTQDDLDYLRTLPNKELIKLLNNIHAQGGEKNE